MGSLPLNNVDDCRKSFKIRKLDLPFPDAELEACSIQYLSGVFQPSPLQITLVVHEIFSYLSTRDLISCRLMNSLWNEVALPIIQNRRPTVLFMTEKSSGNSSDMSSWRLKRFVESMKMSPRIPYLRFGIDGISFRSPIIKQFVKLCGPTALELSIGASSQRLIDLRAFSVLLIRGFPKLEVLVLRQLPVSIMLADSLDLSGVTLADEVSNTSTLFPNLREIHFTRCVKSDQYGTIWKQVFKNAPNLSKISISSYVFSSWTSPTEHKLFKFLEESHRFRTLVELNISYLRVSDFEFLYNAAIHQGMALKTLIINETTGSIDENYEMGVCTLESIASKFLQTQSKSLKILRFASGDKAKSTAFLVPLCLPTMQVLEQLDLIALGFSCRLIVNDVSRDLPKLSSLKIEGYDLQQSLHVTESHSNHELKTLHLSFTSGECCNVKQLGLIFPSVESLHVSEPTLRQIAAIWTSFKQLKSLCIILTSTKSGSGCEWDGAFGNCSSGITNLLANLEENANQPDILSKLLSPSILDLNHLEHLKIAIMDDGMWRKSNVRGRVIEKSPFKPILTAFGDLTSMFILPNMTNLKRLEVDGSQISMRCLERIRKQLPSLIICDTREQVADMF